MRHSWDQPVRPDANNTFRSCRQCGLIRITRHEPDNTPQHWVEFEMDGRKIGGAKTPSCEVARAQMEAAG